MKPDFYHDLRFCQHCRRYVSYLQSLRNAYCVECGGEVLLFSPTDLVAFRQSLRPNEPTVA